MKNKFLTLFLLLITLILIGGIIYIGIYIYSEFSGEDTNTIITQVGGIIFEEINDQKEKKENTSTDFSNLIITENSNEVQSNVQDNDDDINTFFYKQLNKNQKIIYEGLKQSKQFLRQGNYVIKFDDKFSETLKQEDGSDILGDDYQAAIEAFTYDNPDLFYLDVKKMYLNMETKTKFFKTTYNVYIAPANESNYLLDDFQTTEEIEKYILQIEQIRDKVKNNLNGTDYQNIRYIHDCLVDNIQYDTSYQKGGSHSIYGALIRKECVCEGYAKAFKYLANSAGYECELISGTATNSNGESENHLWNCIKLNDNWYEVDPTWDDPIVIGGNGRATNEMKYKYFLKGSKTFEKDHVLEYQFTENGRKFSYPNISQNDYY